MLRDIQKNKKYKGKDKEKAQNVPYFEDKGGDLTMQEVVSVKISN